jgi:hypothetical protein
MAELDGIGASSSGGRRTSRGLMRIVRAAGSSRVEPAPTFNVPSTSGGDWSGLRGVVSAYV